MFDKNTIWLTSRGYLTFEEIKEKAEKTKLAYWVSYYEHLAKYYKK